MLNFGASKPRVKGGPGPRAPPGSAPGLLTTMRLAVRKIYQNSSKTTVISAGDNLTLPQSIILSMCKWTGSALHFMILAHECVLTILNSHQYALFLLRIE